MVVRIDVTEGRSDRHFSTFIFQFFDAAGKSAIYSMCPTIPPLLLPLRSCPRIF